MLVVLSETHSSSGQIKKVKQDSMELPRHFTAEGIDRQGRSLLSTRHDWRANGCRWK